MSKFKFDFGSLYAAAAAGGGCLDEWMEEHIAEDDELESLSLRLGCSAQGHVVGCPLFVLDAAAGKSVVAAIRKVGRSKAIGEPRAAGGGGPTDRLQGDAQAAAWRSASRAAVRTVRKPLLVAIRSHLGARAAPIAAFLGTSQGEAALAAALGVVPLIVPRLSADPRVDRLGSEMRISAMQFMSDGAVDALVDPIADAFSKAVKGLPQP